VSVTAGLLSLGALLLVGTVSPVSAHPEEPDHDVNESTYYTLWAGDTDQANVSVSLDAGESADGSTGTAMRVLATGTDIPLSEPPEAVEQWNRGDHGDFPATAPGTSLAPSEARLRDSGAIRDAYVEIFAIQPSTRALVSPSRQPLYAAPRGQVLATTDYRVQLPPDDTTGNRTVRWRLVTHDLVETRLLVDGDLEHSTGGAHTPSLTYDLDASRSTSGNTTRTLTVETEIEVTLERRVRTLTRTCPLSNATGNATCTSRWTTSTSERTETLTVRDEIAVVPYDLSISGYRARFPNGDLGLVVYKSQPWLGYSLGNTTVRGVWRFYAARDPAWDTLVQRTANDTTTGHSPAHPLQVYAYPIATGPTVAPSDQIALEAVYGETVQSPALSPEVNLDVRTGLYTASYGLATRIETTADVDALTARGLVRGVETTGAEGSFAELVIWESNLTLTVTETTATTTTVRVTLRDAVTGTPIETASRHGFVLLEGERMNTSADGTVTRTVPRPAGALTARYEPGEWWLTFPVYVGDTDVVSVPGQELRVLSFLYRLAIPVSLFLLAVFLIDRITGLSVWPPWRGYR
jgi:hypothetical protein